MRRWIIPNGPNDNDLAATQHPVPSQYMRPHWAPYSPDLQYDVLQHTLQRAHEHGRTTRVFHPGHVANAPPKLHFVEYVQRIFVANEPQLFMPGNANREWLTVTNTTGAVINIMFGRSQGQGMPINNNASFQQSGTTVTVDDIWIRGTVAGAVVSGYQGILSAGQGGIHHKHRAQR